MKLSEIPLGTALICRKKEGYNETIDDSIVEGELYIEIRKDEGMWIEYKLVSQTISYDRDEYEL